MLGDTMMVENISEDTTKKYINKYRWHQRVLRSLLVTFFLLSIMLTISYAQAEPITPPAIITMPGTYELTGDVTGIYDGYGIKIESSDVILDGQGFRLHGSNRAGIGILVNKYGVALSNVQIKNINLGNWDTAIRYNYVRGDEAAISSVSNVQISDSKVGVHVEYSNNILLADLAFTGTNSGIVVNHESNNITIDKTTIAQCGIGVTLENAQAITVSNSNVNTCEVYGVQAGNVQDLTISQTEFSNNKYAAITLANVNDFTIHSNVIANTQIGAALQLSSGVRNGLIYDNLFQSTENVAVQTIANVAWNTEKQPGTNIIGGPYIGGNFWGGAKGQSGFSDITPDNEGYGIIDTSFEIDAYNIDRYPLHKTDKTSIPVETPPVQSFVKTESDISSSDWAITSMPLDEKEITDTVANQFTSQPSQTLAPSTEIQGRSSSALLSVEGMSFLVFIGAPEGATVWLINDSGAEQAGIISGGVLTVPVNSAGPFYIAYRITAPGYATFEEEFRAYPSSSGLSVVYTIALKPASSDETSSTLPSIPTPFPTPASTPFVEPLPTYEEVLTLTPTSTPFIEPVPTYEEVFTLTPTSTPFVEPLPTYKEVMTPSSTPTMLVQETIKPVDDITTTSTPIMLVQETIKPVDDIPTTSTPIMLVQETIKPVDDIPTSSTPEMLVQETIKPVVTTTSTPEMLVQETIKPVDDIPTTPSHTGIGSLTFLVNVDGATVILIDSNDKKHIAGTISQGTLVVPIEIDGDFYYAYRIEKAGYGTVEKYLHNYPKADGENYDITVELEEQSFTIIAAAGPNGTVGPTETIVQAGENLTIRITPSSGYRIEIVQVDGIVLEDPVTEYTFTNIQSDHVLVASFN